MACAGGGFVRLHVDRARLHLQRCLHRIQREGLPIGNAHQVHIAVVGLRDARPAFAELTRAQNQHTIARGGDVCYRGLHDAAARTGHQDHVVLGADECPQLLQHAHVQRAKLRCAVVQVGRGHGELRSGKQRRGTGSKEARFANHVWAVSLASILSSAPIFILVGWLLVRQGRHSEAGDETA